MNSCINIIKIGYLYNKKGFLIKNNKKNLNILKAFIKLNIIKFIKINEKDETLLVYLNYFNNKPVFNNIFNLFKTSHKKSIKLKDLKKLSLKYNWIFLLSTNKGVINNYEAINLKLGGFLIVKIWN